MPAKPGFTQSKRATSGDDLTERELQVGALLTEGLSNKQIADHLKISDGTAKFHVKNLCTKLGTTSRVRAAVLFTLAQR